MMIEIKLNMFLNFRVNFLCFGSDCKQKVYYGSLKALLSYVNICG